MMSHGMTSRSEVTYPVVFKKQDCEAMYAMAGAGGISALSGSLEVYAPTDSTPTLIEVAKVCRAKAEEGVNTFKGAQAPGFTQVDLNFEVGIVSIFFKGKTIPVTELEAATVSFADGDKFEMKASVTQKVKISQPCCVIM